MKYYTLLILIGVSLINQGFALGYIDNETHKNLTIKAVQNSKLDDFLREILGFMYGAEQLLKGGTIDNKEREVNEWLWKSSNYEDINDRAYNHFHNPLNDEGLYNTWLFTGYSAKDWAMGKTKEGNEIDLCNADKSNFSNRKCNAYSYRKARDAYYSALISNTESDRNKNFALMFEMLGRVLHLIEDMGVPAHTRNDFVGGHWSRTGHGGEWIDDNRYDVFNRCNFSIHCGYLSILTPISAYLNPFDD